uniref:PDZ domain-containing protein n=1 Tax=Noctiluca scintillans TaxID=2966 RepID=A0A7S1B1S0_NOCSC
MFDWYRNVFCCTDLIDTTPIQPMASLSLLDDDCDSHASVPTESSRNFDHVEYRVGKHELSSPNSLCNLLERPSGAESDRANQQRIEFGDGQRPKQHKPNCTPPPSPKAVPATKLLGFGAMAAAGTSVCCASSWVGDGSTSDFMMDGATPVKGVQDCSHPSLASQQTCMTSLVCCAAENSQFRASSSSAIPTADMPFRARESSEHFPTAAGSFQAAMESAASKGMRTEDNVSEATSSIMSETPTRIRDADFDELRPRRNTRQKEAEETQKCKDALSVGTSSVTSDPMSIKMRDADFERAEQRRKKDRAIEKVERILKNSNTADLPPAEQEDDPDFIADLTLANRDLGLKIMVDREKHVVRVGAMMDSGAAVLWNRANPDQQIEAGDIVLMVNGETEVAKMLKAKAKGNKFTMAIKKSSKV